MAQQGTLELILRNLAEALRPLEQAMATEENFIRFIYRLGWQVNGLPPSYIALGAKVGSTVAAIEALVDEPTPQEVFDLLKEIKDIYTAIKNISDAPPGVNAGVFIPEITARLFELLLTDYLANAQADVYNYLQLFGVIEFDQVPAAGDRPSFILPKILWNELPAIITEPSKIPQMVFGWGTPDFKSEIAFHLLSELFHIVGLPVAIVKVDEALAQGYQPAGNFAELIKSKLRVPFYYLEIAGTVREFGFELIELPGQGSKLPGIIIQPVIPSEVGATLRLSDVVNMRIRANSNIDSLFGLIIRPNEFAVKYPLSSPETLPEGGFAIGFDFAPSAPAILVGAPNDVRIQIKGVTLDFAFNLTLGDEPEVIITAGLQELALILSAGNSDGFLKTLLGDGETKIDFSLQVIWSNKDGIKFIGGGGFEIALHPHLNLGPISIEDILIRLIAASAPTPSIKLETGASIKASLGPLTAVVNNIGMSLNANFTPGNAGPFDLGLGFKPPTGVGLSIDTGLIKGGGFLNLDFEKGEYIGALELDFKGMLSLKAIGIINTKMPDGSEGFSLLIIITAEFTPIQLGFGFTLIGVGGLLGLNRTMRIDALREGIKTNALKSILFPTDIIANINRIVSDIKQIFPIQQGHFIVGPMGKLGWGTPALITLELGILIEIPEPRIAIIGVLKVLLPNEEAPLLRMQINFLGVIDFENKYISFDASLYDSRLLVFTLTGDMAFRLSWGDNPVFILTVGGFHPAFKEAPADLQHMTRLTIALVAGDNPRITIQCYFAVTSNTVQFGAKAELYAAAAGFNIYGYVGFDVLFQFDPFKFIAAIYAGLALRKGTRVLMGITVSGQLAGPKPWDLKGEASFSILFFDITISFHETWGDKDNKVDAPKADLLQMLTTEINDVRNWTAVIPDKNNLHVSVKKIEQEGELLTIHPFGVLTFSERLLPLDLVIQKFGTKVPKDANKFSITEVKSGTKELATAGVTEQFAPANFIELKDSDKLSSPSFEAMKSGFKITASTELSITAPVNKSVDYELSYLKKKRFSLLFAGIYKYAKTIFKGNVKAGAVGQSKLSFDLKRSSLNAPDEITIVKNQFAVANISDMKLHQADLVAASYTEAAQMARELVTKNPELKDKVQVLAHFEINQN